MTMENGKNLIHSFSNGNFQGLNKREYFAGLAMQGLISSKFCVNQTILVENAILFADEILKQLED